MHTHEPIGCRALLFREFEPSDIERCTRLAAQAWPVREHISRGGEGWRIFEPYVRIGLDWSNWTCVACDDSGEVVGLVFGEIRGLDGSRSISGVVRSEIRAFGGTAVGRYGKMERMLPALWNFMMTEMKLLVGRPEADAEIMLLLLDESYRGKGIGRDLVDRFADAARKAGSKRMSVYTDDQASNWRFYERYGFKRASQFYDNWSSYFEGRACTGIRFVVEL
jgi:GNAT superfamily N-acetyltransferase